MGRNVWLCAVLFGLSLMTHSARAEESATDAIDAAVDRAETLGNQGHPDAALQLLKPYAQSGSADAEYALAYWHMRAALSDAGSGAVDPVAIRPALEFAARAAEHGNADAWTLLYTIHSNGIGVPVNAFAAMEYLQKGAAAGNSSAVLNMAILKYFGTPAVARDVDGSCKLLRTLLDEPGAGPIASYFLGLAQMRGQCGMKRDEAKAAAMIARGAQAGDKGAQRDLGELYERGLGVPENLETALSWFGKAAAQGDPYSQWRMGMAHLQGAFGTPDRERAIALFRVAAEADDPNGLASLAVMYATGDGVPQDFAQARNLYQRAADAGNAHALRNLAVMAIQGEGEPRDPVRAALLYQQAVELGDDELPMLWKQIEAQLAPEQRAEVDKRMKDWRAQRKS